VHESNVHTCTPAHLHTFRMRTFFCIELEDEIKEKLDGIASGLKRGTEARVNWVRRENLHVTLRFLGEVAPEQIEELQLAAEVASESIGSFELELDLLGAFPNRERPRVIWAGSSSPPPEILQLYEQLERGLHPLGFPSEGKPYTPHITLGRVKERNRAKLGRLAERLGDVEPFHFVAEAAALTLMESRLRPSGAIYTPIFIQEF
jgi:2'-5' RNA ligase